MQRSRTSQEARIHIPELRLVTSYTGVNHETIATTVIQGGVIALTWSTWPRVPLLHTGFSLVRKGDNGDIEAYRASHRFIDRSQYTRVK